VPNLATIAGYRILVTNLFLRADMKSTSSEEISGCGAKRGFGRSASTYESLSNLFSAGLILSAKKSQLKWLKPDSTVLYLGVGAGEDASMAAQQGVHLTCLDISPRMLDEVKKKVGEQQLPVEYICGNALEHQRWAHYDVVVCNFFLNCFEEMHCIEMLTHAASLIRPGGYMLIADVAAPRGNWCHRGLTTAYLKSGMIFFWLGGMVKLHGIYDYRNYFPGAGLRLVESAPLRMGKFGPVVYESLVAEKVSS
jgi:demethylphylloquinol methyltransferase